MSRSPTEGGESRNPLENRCTERYRWFESLLLRHRSPRFPSGFQDSISSREFPRTQYLPALVFLIEELPVSCDEEGRGIPGEDPPKVIISSLARSARRRLHLDDGAGGGEIAQDDVQFGGRESMPAADLCRLIFDIDIRRINNDFLIDEGD
jgi:hypothetical protein